MKKDPFDSPSIVYEKALAADNPFLMTLRMLTMVEHLEKMGLYFSEAEHQERVNYWFEQCFLIVVDNQKAGMIKYQEFAEHIEIKQIQIHPNYQGRGIGKQVVQEIIEQGVHSKKKVKLSVLKANPAKNLYQRLGFVITGEDEEEYYLEFNVNH